MSSTVTIVDVSPRDGLQNESVLLPVATRVELIRRLQSTGLPRIEIGSFVSPNAVPQMAGTSEVCAALEEPAGTSYTALIPNMRGYEMARDAGVRHVRLVLAASESLHRANFRRSIRDSLDDFAQIAVRAAADELAFGVAIGASFGCPFEGHVPPAAVLDVATQVLGLGADELVLADTTGMAVPTQVHDLCTQVLERADGVTVGVHLHNTRNTGYANAYAAWQAGITSFDASLGGIGGCPFAPRAVGNVATEDLVHMFNGMGVETGVDLEALLDVSAWLSDRFEKTLPAMLGRAEPVFTTIRRPPGVRAGR